MRALAATFCLIVFLAGPVLASESDSRDEKERLTPVCPGLIDPFIKELKISAEHRRRISAEHPRGCFLAAMHQSVEEAYLLISP
jgi:hypothetical protein